MVQARWYNEDTGTWEKFIVSNEGIQGPPGPLPDEDKIVRDLKEKVETDLEPTLLGLSEAELARAQAELDRQAQEEARETAEAAREEAEGERETTFASYGPTLDAKADKSYVDAELEKKANKKQEEWITPTLLNGYVSDSKKEIQFFKDSLGFVHIRGTASEGVMLEPIFVLPSGFRPTKTYSFPTLTGLTSNGQVDIQTNANVRVRSTGSHGFDGISFPTN